MKHNKKKNIGIIFDLLLKEYYSCSDDNKKIIIESIIFKYFNSKSILLKEYNCYNVLSSVRGMNERDSERYLNIIKEEYKNLNHEENEKQLSLLKEDISKHLGKEFYDNFTTSYKVYATIYGVLNETCENSLEKFELENKILDLMRSEDVKKTNYIVEHSDILTYNTYCKKFNSKYLSLNENQKLLFEKFIKSIDDDVDFTLTLNEELHNCKKILEERIKIEKDSKLIERINETLKEITNFNSKNKITNEDFEFVLNLQEVCGYIK